VKRNYTYVIGIDEAGRGPLAGPVALGVALVPSDFSWNRIEGVGDSKKISPKKREIVFKRALELQKEGELDFKVILISAKTIDTVGIVQSIKQAMEKALIHIEKKYLTKPRTSDVLGLQRKNPRPCLGNLPRQGLGFGRNILVKLDGGLKAPEWYVNQETIIKGDSKEKVIGLASIMAKVTRDRYMVQKSTESIFAPYTFAIHKGYGTKAHREAIAKYGLSKEHRKTFCTKITFT